ncbi:LCD1 [Candida oxycetoniae]|uniref:LCD1 n=1 Tax=Candida oxycetoniae TaxID=497107 RepID=A0AAI9SZS3_9ASCO|nr:LCD1 [Candida oxycetoniae]KAI3405795.2 LCD1 [Candida oxycetoniae]
MPDSDSDFANDDEDDEILQGYLTGRTQIPPKSVSCGMAPVETVVSPPPASAAPSAAPAAPSAAAPSAAPAAPSAAAPTSQILEEIPLNAQIQARLFQADGEIATLKAQFLRFQNSKRDELADLRRSYEALKKSKEAETEALKEVVHKLEDDRKFLKNELITATSHKKRKIDISQNEEQQTTLQVSSTASGDFHPRGEIPLERVVKFENETLTLFDHLQKYCIVGAQRSSFEYLSKICYDFELDTLYGFRIKKKQPVSFALLEFLMSMRELRLDEVIEKFVFSIIDITKQAMSNRLVLSIPFLISLVHCAINFRPVAVTQKLIIEIIETLSQWAVKYSYLLNSNLEETIDGDVYHEHYDPLQITALERLLLVELVDTTEKVLSLTAQFESGFIIKVWNKVSSTKLVSVFLPQNTERFKSNVQINTVYSIVEMLESSITDDTFAFNNSEMDTTIISSLIKVFLIDIPIKQGFRFYGLNRILGNNTDMQIVDLAVPKEHDRLNNYVVCIPQPIRDIDTQTEQITEVEKDNHLFHLLNLQIRVAELLVSLIITKQTVEFLHDKDHFKSLVRIIGMQQSEVTKSPRSQLVGSKLYLIAILVKIIDYLTQDLREASELMYSETMYELFVVFSRIAFGTDSLSSDAYNLLKKARTKGYYELPVFNEWCETRARQINHVSTKDYSGRYLANIESNFSNGLEIPYDNETVELAREVLNRYVNHEEADNLYFNMNPEYDDINAIDDDEDDEEMNI